MYGVYVNACGAYGMCVLKCIVTCFPSDDASVGLNVAHVCVIKLLRTLYYYSLSFIYIILLSSLTCIIIQFVMILFVSVLFLLLLIFFQLIIKNY